MIFRSLILAALALELLGGIAHAFEVQADGGSKFVVPIPEEFEHVFSSQNPVELHEFVPTGESMTNWSEMITVSSMPGNYIDTNGALKDYASLKLLAYIGTCNDALMEPVMEPGRIGDKVSFSTSFGCATKAEVRTSPQVDVRKFEFLSVTYVQGDDKVYEVQRAVHLDELTLGNLTDVMKHNQSNLAFTKSAFSNCCGG
jgi:hypothetical protein